MFLTDDDKRALLLADALRHLELSRKAAKELGMGWEIDDSYIEIRDVLEFEE